MNDIWFTSDTHFGHANIIKYCKRPFSSTQEMNEIMIQNWNKVVKPGDLVYHLGDFAFYKESENVKVEDVQTFSHRLNGNIYLILGNHDRDEKCLKQEKFVWMRDHHSITSKNKKRIVLCHYAMRVWNGSHKGSLMLYGHSHGNLEGDSQSLDVGVDCWDFTPVNLDQIKERMVKSNPHIHLDHHGAD